MFSKTEYGSNLDRLIKEGAVLDNPKVGYLGQPLIYLLGKILFAAFVRLRAHPADSNVPMLLIATSLLLHGFVSGTYFHMHSMITFGIARGFLLKTGEPHQSQKH